MSLEELVPELERNMLRTYLSIATAGGGVSEPIGPNVLCGSDNIHPLCNFAYVRELSPEVEEALAGFVVVHPTATVYGMPGAVLSELMPPLQFELAYELAMMAWNGSYGPSGMLMTAAASKVEREEIARFMGKQFFPRQTSSSRELLVKATSQSKTELYWFSSLGQRVGAAMLSLTPGMVGIYNVCVDQALRGQNHGLGIVRECLNAAAQRGLPAGLQCEAHLEDWYAQNGLQKLEKISVYRPR